MDKKRLPNFDFDPDFSEYNPILGEFTEIQPKKEKESFFANFIKKISCRLLIQLY